MTRRHLACLSIFLAACVGDIGAIPLPVPATGEGEIGKGYFELGGVVQYLSYTIEDGKKVTGGDVLLDEELPLRVAVEAIEDQEGERTITFLATEAKYLWKSNKIPYRFDGKVDSKIRERVELAMQHIEEVTSVQFRKRDNESDYVEIQPLKDPNIGGQSVVGRYKGGRRDVWLNKNASSGTALHELLHVIGGNHEHQRSDRDNHVKVHMENVRDGYDFCFEKLKGNKKGPYTLDSIMHYGSWAFSKSTKMTITARDGSRVPGQRVRLTSNDAEAISKMYPQEEPSVEYGDDWIMAKCSESQKDQCSLKYVYSPTTGCVANYYGSSYQCKTICLANKYGAYQWKIDPARCPAAITPGTTTPGTTPAAPGTPVIESAGSGCDDLNCIWIRGTDFRSQAYVDIRPVGSNTIIGSYHGLSVQQNSVKNGTPVFNISLRLKTQTEMALFASQGLRVWVVNPDTGKWSNEVLVKR